MMEDLMIAIGRWILTLARHIRTALLPDPKPELDLEHLQLSAQAVAGMEALGGAMRAYKITLGAAHEEDALSGPYYEVGNSTPQWYRKTGTFRGADILEPVPEYEQMQFAQADWKAEGE